MCGHSVHVHAYRVKRRVHSQVPCRRFTSANLDQPRLLSSQQCPKATNHVSGFTQLPLGVIATITVVRVPAWLLPLAAPQTARCVVVQTEDLKIPPKTRVLSAAIVLDIDLG